jgi:hypothetical protein
LFPYVQLNAIEIVVNNNFLDIDFRIPARGDRAPAASAGFEIGDALGVDADGKGECAD